MSRLRIAILAVSALGLVLGGCAAPPSTSVGDVVVGPTVLGGELHVSTFQVQAGATAQFDRDLIVNSDGDILILGTLQGLSGDPGRDDARGADLVLRSKTRIVIAGEILGAPGRDGSLNPEALAVLGEDPAHTRLDGTQATQRLATLLAQRPGAVTNVRILDGGRGGHLILDAPEIYLEKIVAGAGGAGGPGGSGGAGGNIYQPCGLAFRPGSVGGIGGAAGDAGPAVRGFNSGRPGNGGNGGGGVFWPPPVAIR